MLVNAERPAILYGQQVWTARGHKEAIALLRGLDIPGYFNGASRGLLPPGDPHHFDRTRTQAFANADVLVIVGTPFDFRMGYGKRISKDLKLVQIDMDYRTVGKNRDIDLGLVGDPGAILGAVLQAAVGPHQERQAPGAQAVAEAARRCRGRRIRKAHAPVQIEQRADSSVSRRLGTERVPRRQHHLHRRRRRRGDHLRASGAPARSGPMDGSGRARLARRRHRLCDRGGPRESRKRSPVLLRRRLVRHDRLRHGDGQPLRRALYRRHRQQLGDEPDSLWPAREIRRAARQRRQSVGRRAVRQICRDARRLRRGSARPGADRAGVAARARVGAEICATRR